jgi:hypothetical protein
MPFDSTNYDERISTLQRMKHELEQRGWCQSYCVNETGNVCLAGALLATRGHIVKDAYDEWEVCFNLADGSAETKRAYDDLITILGPCFEHEALGQQTYWPGWNDECGRTREQVLQLIDNRIAELQSVPR